jgi:hypothetical protein
MISKTCVRFDNCSILQHEQEKAQKGLSERALTGRDILASQVNCFRLGLIAALLRQVSRSETHTTRFAYRHELYNKGGSSLRDGQPGFSGSIIYLLALETLALLKCSWLSGQIALMESACGSRP